MSLKNSEDVNCSVNFFDENNAYVIMKYYLLIPFFWLNFEIILTDCLIGFRITPP